METKTTRASGWLSVNRTAELLDVSRATVYRLIRRGEIPVVRIGGRLRVPIDELREMLKPAGPGS